MDGAHGAQRNTPEQEMKNSTTVRPSELKAELSATMKTGMTEKSAAEKLAKQWKASALKAKTPALVLARFYRSTMFAKIAQSAC